LIGFSCYLGLNHGFERGIGGSCGKKHSISLSTLVIECISDIYKMYNRKKDF
jgi:hypothetical protein